MKKYIRPILITFVIIAGISLSQVSFAQPPSPPPSGGNGGSNTPMGGSAPIDSGMIYLLAAGIGYGANKIYQLRNTRKETK